jgi:hypothetical protein
MTYNLAKKMGYAAIIEGAGGTFLEGNCLVISPLGKRSVRTIMTDSAKFAYYLPSEHNLKIRFSSTAECVQAIIED